MKAFFAARVSGTIDIQVLEYTGKNHCCLISSKVIGAASANKAKLRFASLGGLSFAKLFGLTSEQKSAVVAALADLKASQCLELRFVADGDYAPEGHVMRGFLSSVKSERDFGPAQEWRLSTLNGVPVGGAE